MLRRKIFLRRRGDLLPKKVLTPKIIFREYIVGGKSDSQIAAEYGVSKEGARQARTRFGFGVRGNTRDTGLSYVVNMLTRKGYEVEKLSKNSHYGLLINSKIKVSVKSAIMSDNGKTFYFSMSHRGSDIKSPKYCTKLPNGKMCKDISKVCDLLILCGIISAKKVRLFIIPSSDIPTLSSIKIPVNSNGKYWNYHNKFIFLDRLLDLES